MSIVAACVGLGRSEHQAVTLLAQASEALPRIIHLIPRGHPRIFRSENVRIVDDDDIGDKAFHHLPVIQDGSNTPDVHGGIGMDGHFEIGLVRIESTSLHELLACLDASCLGQGLIEDTCLGTDLEPFSLFLFLVFPLGALWLDYLGGHVYVPAQVRSGRPLSKVGSYPDHGLMF